MKPVFASVRTACVPVVLGCEESVAVAAARALAPRVQLIGIVPLPNDTPLSAGAQLGRLMRQRLHALEDGAQVRGDAPVIVSLTPWADLQKAIAKEEPDLLVLNIAAHLAALKVSAAEALAHLNCDLVLVRGPLPARRACVLVPVRGGPYAELALRLGVSLQPKKLTALHVRLSGQSEAPFRGLAQVLKNMPDVETRSVVTKDAARLIVAESADCDVVVLGATAHPTHGPDSLGPVADRVLRDSPAAVMVVKTRRPMPESLADESAGAGAISILVDKWFVENTYHADEFADLAKLLALKRAQGLTISLALPALNEAATVGKVIRTIRRALMDRTPLLDEIVLIDSDSTDRTREIASQLDVPVYIHQQLLPGYGARRGKGEALWKSLLVTRGDIIAWIDTDIVNIHPRFVYGILGPLLLNPRIQFVKGFYRRPLKVGEKVQAGGGGRVTELTARPLLNLFYPELSGVIQPLSGEYAGRRRALERCVFFSGYGVETGLLIDIFERHGLSAIAQVDLLERVHHNQELQALSKMSFAIIQTVLRKIERRYERAIVEDVNKTMKLPRFEDNGYFLDVEEIAERERPPMIELPDYQKRKRRPGAWKLPP
jgi:glucosyl-3-phosphoglycerate synthase